MMLSKQKERIELNFIQQQQRGQECITDVERLTKCGKRRVHRGKKGQRQRVY